MESTTSILDGAAKEADFAQANNVSQRTVARYRNQSDGLPFFVWGGEVYIPLADAKEWLRSRVKRLNTRRRAA
jgi:hypothetical protein